MRRLNVNTIRPYILGQSMPPTSSAISDSIASVADSAFLQLFEVNSARNTSSLWLSLTVVRIPIRRCNVVVQRLSAAVLQRHALNQSASEVACQAAVSCEPPLQLNERLHLVEEIPVSDRARVESVVQPVAAAEPPRRRRHAAGPYRTTYRHARNPELNYLPVVEYSLGPYTSHCGLCDTAFFVEDYSNREGQYNQCCHIGKVSLPPIA